MTKMIFIVLISASVFLSCNKAPDITPGTADFSKLEQSVLTDFTNNVALSSYLNLSVKANNLNIALQNLNANTTDANLTTAKQAWLDMRTVWEQSEGFLFGPVEDNDYDPNMDTWPTDYVQMDSLLASNNALEVSDVQNFTLSLRGFHPIEYMIFGDHGTRTAASLTARQKLYISSLSTDITNTCNDLYLSWSSAPVNFAQQVITAGKGSTKYAKRQEAFLAMTGALIGICEEVGEGKMKEPFDARDPQLVESPYSGNSATDFKNNIIGIRNVYMGLNGGKGLKDLVAAKNKSLDNTIQNQITAAINSFDNITQPYEEAITNQRTQIQQTMSALATLKETLEGDLTLFIQQNILD
jgi:predicted lipoprotein